MLGQYPVDVLAVEEEADTPSGARYWETWLQQCPLSTRPDLVLVCTGSDELVREDGLHAKPWREKVASLGYDAGFWFLRATDHGGVVRQDRLMMVLQKVSSIRPRVEHGPQAADEKSSVRASSNMLKTHQIPAKAWDTKGWNAHKVDDQLNQAASPCKIVGSARLDRKPVFCPSGSLPDGIGAWMKVSDQRGRTRLRTLLVEELAKAKGIPSSWDLTSR